MNKPKAQKQAEVSNNLRITKPYETIKLGIDWHAHHYRVVRIIDNAGPEPAQRFSPDHFLLWVEKQKQMAQQVYSCYEAGAGGFVLHRQLTAQSVTNYVVSASGDQHCDLPITKAGNIRLRTLLIELAWLMVRHQPQSQACRALSYKLIRIYFACWQRRQTYQSERYLRALEIHGSPLHSKLQIQTRPCE